MMADKNSNFLDLIKNLLLRFFEGDGNKFEIEKYPLYFGYLVKSELNVLIILLFVP